MSKITRTRPIPTLNTPSISDEDRFECEECKRMFDTERGLSMHLTKIHGYQDVTPKPSNMRKQTRLTFGQKIKIVNYLRQRKDEIADKRMTKSEVIAEIAEVFGLEKLSASHISQPLVEVGIKFAGGWKKEPPIIIKQDNQTILTIALAIQELYAKLGEEAPRILTQLKEQVQAEIRKEQDAKLQLEKMKQQLSDGPGQGTDA